MRSRWTEMSAFSDNKGSAAHILPCLTMHAAAHACFSVQITVCECWCLA